MNLLQARRTAMINLLALLAYLVGLATFGPSAHAQSAPTVQWCIPASEGGTRGCYGPQWSTAVPGHCGTKQAKPGEYGSCTMAGTQTLVTVHEYNLVWDRI